MSSKPSRVQPPSPPPSPGDEVPLQILFPEMLSKQDLQLAIQPFLRQMLRLETEENAEWKQWTEDMEEGKRLQWEVDATAELLQGLKEKCRQTVDDAFKAHQTEQVLKLVFRFVPVEDLLKYRTFNPLWHKLATLEMGNRLSYDVIIPSLQFYELVETVERGNALAVDWPTPFRGLSIMSPQEKSTSYLDLRRLLLAFQNHVTELHFPREFRMAPFPEALPPLLFPHVKYLELAATNQSARDAWNVWLVRNSPNLCRLSLVFSFTDQRSSINKNHMPLLKSLANMKTLKLKWLILYPTEPCEIQNLPHLDELVKSQRKSLDFLFLKKTITINEVAAAEPPLKGVKFPKLRILVAGTGVLKYLFGSPQNLPPVRVLGLNWTEFDENPLAWVDQWSGSPLPSMELVLIFGDLTSMEYTAMCQWLTAICKIFPTKDIQVAGDNPCCLIETWQQYIDHVANIGVNQNRDSE